MIEIHKKDLKDEMIDARKFFDRHRVDFIKVTRNRDGGFDYETHCY